MKRLVVILLVALLIPLAAAEPFQWVVELNFPPEEVEYVDGALFVGAHAESETDRNVLLVKFVDGKQVWAREYGGDKGDVLGSMVSYGNGLLLAGTTYSFGRLGAGFLMAVDNDGKVLWAKTYRGPLGQGMLEAAVPGENGIVATGSVVIEGFNGREFALWVLKTNRNGSVVWSRVYNIEDGLETGGGIAVSGNRIAVAGTTSEPDGSILLLLDGNGRLLKKLVFGGISVDRIAPTPDGGFIAGGLDGSLVRKSFAVLIKLSGEFDIEWFLEYQGDDYLDVSDVEPLGNSYIAGGRSVLMEVSSNGSVRWASRIYVNSLSRADGLLAFCGVVEDEKPKRVAGIFDPGSGKVPFGEPMELLVSEGSPYSPEVELTAMDVETEEEAVQMGTREGRVKFRELWRVGTPTSRPTTSSVTERRESEPKSPTKTGTDKPKDNGKETCGPGVLVPMALLVLLKKRRER